MGISNFSVIYEFHVKPGMEAEFIAHWNALTKLIYEYEGSLGSKLHNAGGNVFVAYAQWPDRVTWQNSGAKLSDLSATHREGMKSCCIEIKTLFELEPVSDHLKSDLFSGS